MSQVRLSLTAAGPAARRAYAMLETAFEDEGYPLGILELDEAADLHEITLYVDGDAGPALARMRALLEAIVDPVEVRHEALPDIDWVAHSLEGLKPVRAGRFFVHGRHDREKRRPNDIAIEIEAGQAFGTGSAVLAIGLAKLVRIPVLATDIDPIATRVAEANVRLNGMQALVKTRTATGFQHPVFARKGPFDLIVATILPRPLMRLAPDMARHLAPGGSLILSGILDRQRRAVLAAYANQRFRHLATLHREGWVTLHLKRH
jgi:ribosomal protein L11 methyltransferase